MTKEEFVEKVSKLPGVGKKKAEALYDAGYTSIDELKAASKADLEKVDGIGPKVADAILAGISEEEAAPQKVQVVEEKQREGAKGTPAAEIVDTERAYRVKIKPDLPEDLEATLRIRAIRRAREPRFLRHYWWYARKLEHVWRAPKGELSKQRRGFKYRSAKVKVGYGKPAATRGLHPTGFEEILVHNVNDLEGLDPKTQAARIGGTVGKRKRRDILAKAGEMKVRVLNPGVL